MKKFFISALLVLFVLAASSFASADWFGSGFSRGITGFAVLGTGGSEAGSSDSNAGIKMRDAKP